MVFVVNKDGKPLMPTTRHRKVRLWLKAKQARVFRRTPFTIQLLFETTNYVDKLSLGVDPGYKHAGLSVVSDTKEYLREEIQLRTDIPKLLIEKKMYRRGRRQKNTRYRQPRFLNRKNTFDLPPSIRQKIECHKFLIELVKKILPISRLRIEANKFNPAELKAVDGIRDWKAPDDASYQNVRAYVLARDSHTCYFNDGSCVKKLNVHHIRFRSDGGSDAPYNLLTLCEHHHDLYHHKKITLPSVVHRSYKEATVMNIIRSRLLAAYPEAEPTYGYLTASTRRQLGVEKTHSNDAFIAAGGTTQERCALRTWKFKRKNNRCLQINRNGFKPAVRKQRYSIQPQDIVMWKNRRYTAKGMQNKGSYLKMTNGIQDLVKPMRQIQVVYHQKTLVLVDGGMA